MPKLFVIFICVVTLIVLVYVAWRDHPYRDEIKPEMYERVHDHLNNRCPSVTPLVKKAVEDDGIFDRWEYDSFLAMCERFDERVESKENILKFLKEKERQ